MVEKNRQKTKSDALGISGFTLAIAGYFLLLIQPIISIAFFVVSLIFCIIQQKRSKTKLGKIGLIISIIGVILSIAITILLVTYLIPYVQQIATEQGMTYT